MDSTPILVFSLSSAILYVVTPMELAMLTVSRAVWSFHPASMPMLSRRHYRRELAAWSLLPVAIGAVEGTVVGVIAKYGFAGTVPTATLNMMVAILAAASSFANIMSFAWAAWSHGRDKIRATVFMQVATLVCIAAAGLMPFNAIGLYGFVACVIGARVCWSGVVILRSTVWGANYPREVRARMAGKLATIQSLIMAGVALMIGQALQWDREAIHIVFPAAAVIGGVGAFIYSRMRMRGHRALIKRERADAHGNNATAPSFNPLRWRAILLQNVKYRQYQTAMYIFGMGNLMVTAPLVIMVKDRFLLDREGVATLITATIPLLMMPLTIPVWARLLDRMHIIRFRAIHSWTFVLAIALMLVAAIYVEPWVLYLSAVMQGIAFGGGVLGWNLGHHDFAPPEQVSQYMGVHVTLTGIRGIAGPMLAVGVYESLEWWHRGAGAWVFALALTLSVIGALGFVHLARKYT